MQASKCAGETTTLALKPGGAHEVQNRGNQWPHKMDLGPTKKYLKKQQKQHNLCTMYAFRSPGTQPMVILSFFAEILSFYTIFTRKQVTTANLVTHFLKKAKHWNLPAL